MHNDLDRRNVNYYDAIFAGDPKRVIELMPYDQKLFESANIGNQAFTNLHVPLSGRSTSLMLTNIYARTTLPDAPGFRQFANWTVVNIKVGEFSLATCSLDSLFMRSEGYCMGNFEGRIQDPKEKADRDDLAIRGTASRLYDAVEKPMVSYTLYKDGFDPVVRDRWMKIAKVALDEILHKGRPIFVGPRQSLRVTTTTYKPGLDALKRMLAEYPETGDASNWPGCWVHLEGVETSESR